MRYEEYNGNISEKQEKFAMRIVNLCGYAMENYRDFEKIVNEDLSADYTAMKLILDLYDEVYERCSQKEKEKLEAFEKHNVENQINIIECLNQLEKNYKILDNKKDIVIDHDLEFMEFAEFINTSYACYENHMEKLFEVAEISAGLNAEINEFLTKNDCINPETETVEFDFIFENEKDYETVKEYFEKCNNIKNFIDNLAESCTFVLGEIEEENSRVI